MKSLYDCASPSLREEAGLFAEEVGDALVSGSERDGSILYNRAVGLGTRAPVDRAAVEAVHAVYERHGRPRYFLHVYPSTLTEGDATLEGTPLVKTRGWMKFQRDASPPLERETTLRVERVESEEHATHFGRIVAGAFGMSDLLAPVAAGIWRDPRWNLFLSWDRDEPAGAGGLFVDGEDALVEWGATDPRFRRRGSQGAVMAARIARARELGCTRLFTETGESVPDDPQHSYRNIERHGFVAGTLRENWAPPKP